MSVVEIINAIEADKLSRHIRPLDAHVLEIEKKASTIYSFMHREIVQAELDELERQGTIRIGRSLNDNYITVL